MVAAVEHAFIVYFRQTVSPLPFNGYADQVADLCEWTFGTTDWFYCWPH